MLCQDRRYVEDVALQIRREEAYKWYSMESREEGRRGRGGGESIAFKTEDFAPSRLHSPTYSRTSADGRKEDPHEGVVCCRLLRGEMIIAARTMQ